MTAPTTEQVTQALATVLDPEIRRPITDLGMVKNIDVGPGGTVRVDVWLTVSGCPMRDTITRSVREAVEKVGRRDRGQGRARRDERGSAQGPADHAARRQAEREIPFASPASLTKVYAVASGKGGVGKSSVTVNLAVALAAAGQKVGLLDADIYGHSVPRMLGVSARPTQVEQMIMPPVAHGVKAISSGMLKKGNEPLPLRGTDPAPAAPAVPGRRLLGRSRRAAARPAARHRRRRDLGWPPDPRRRADRRHDAADSRRRGRRARRLAGHPAAPAGSRRDREHGVPAVPALQRADRGVRQGRRPRRRAGAHPAHRRGRSRARRGADRPAAARGRR